MLQVSRDETSIDQLAGRLRKARTVAPGTIPDVISHACRRVGSQAPYARDHLNRLIAAGAWIDAALELLNLEAPHWKLRRLALDDGEWLCTLSRQPQLPIELDDTVESHHQNAAIAILLALVETQRRTTPAERPLPAALERRPAAALICDNFA